LWLVCLACLKGALNLSASEWRVTYGQSLTNYQATTQTLTNQGFRPISLDVDGAGTASSFSVVWVKDGFTDWVVETGLTVDQFRARISTRTGQGYRVLCLDSYGNYPNELYAAVWVKDEKAADFLVDLRDSNWSQIHTRWNAGYCPTWADFNSPSGSWVSTVYCKRSFWNYSWRGLSEASIREKIQEGAPRAWPVVVRGYGTVFAVIGMDPDWLQCQESRIELNQSAADLDQAMEQFWMDGYEPVSVTQCAGKYNCVWKRPVGAPEPNRMASLEPLGSGEIQVRIQNDDAPGDLNRYFELVPVQASADLAQWEPLTTLFKTNAAPEPALWIDREAGSRPMRFYRTPAARFITPLLKPTGPYGVGEFSRLLTDPARFDAARGTNLQFMVTCWYPAPPQGGRVPAPYVGGLLASNLDYFPYVSRFLPRSRVASFAAHASVGAPLATNLSLWPVVLYPGNVNFHRRDNLMFVEELASHGFVVVGLDHRDTPGQVFPDGTLVLGEGFKPSSDAMFEPERCEYLADAQFVLDQLAQWQSTDSLLAGHLDLAHVGAFGFGFGGSTAANLANADARCHAAADMEGHVFGDALVTNGCAKPFLLVRSDSADPEYDGDNRLEVFQRSQTAAYYLKFAGTANMSFSDQGFLLDVAALNAWFGTTATTDGLRVHDLTRSALVSFFKRHLKGEEDGVLDGFFNNCPDVSLALQINCGP
jgi:dienelactone hydrolase